MRRPFDQLQRLWLSCLKLAGRSPRSAAVACWRDGTVLLVKNTYSPIITLPGGLVRARESYRQAAVRELREEVGLCTRPEALVAVPSRSGRALFELVLEPGKEPVADGIEVAWAGLVSSDDALALRLSTRVRGYLLWRGGGGSAGFRW